MFETVLFAGLVCGAIVPGTVPAAKADHRVSRPSGEPGPTYPGPARAGSALPDLPEHADAPAEPAGFERWQAAGVTFGISSIWDLSATTSGAGGRRGVARGLIDTSIGVDLEKTLGVTGASAFAQFLWKGGPNGSSVTGDLQGSSNIDAEPFSGLGELWIESRLGERLRIKTGRVDANTEFAGVDTAGDFLNSAMGVSPAISHLPTYPSPAMSLNAFIDVHTRLSLGAGVYGEADGGARWQRPFSIVQGGTHWAIGAGEGRATVGAWRKRGGTLPIERGLYAVVEQTLWMGSDEGARLSSFIQWGHTGGTCGFDRHAGGGLVWTGWLRSQPDGALGVAVTGVRTGSHAELPGQRELVLNSYAKIDLVRGLALIPDVQVIRSPGAAGGSRVVGTLRMTAGF